LSDEKSEKNLVAVQAGPSIAATPPPHGAELAYLVASTKNEAFCARLMTWTEKSPPPSLPSVSRLPP
jgi:hypothetical protein